MFEVTRNGNIREFDCPFKQINLEINSDGFRQLFTMFWDDEMGMTVVVRFFAVPQEWQKYIGTFQKMARFKLFNVGKKAVDLEAVKLLSGQEAFDRSMSAEELDLHMQAVRNVVTKSIGEPTETCLLMLDTTFSQDAKPAYKIRSDGEVAQATLDRTFKALDQLPDTRTKEPLKCQFLFSINRNH